MSGIPFPDLRRSTWWYLGGSVAAAAIVIPSLFGTPTFSSSADTGTAQAQTQQVDEAPRVETVHPTAGGLGRHTSQPGTAHSYESADVFAKASGFLQAQHVDIGSRVKRGDLLAEIDVPELAKDVEAATAAWQQSLAEVTQAEAHVDSAIADHKAAEAKIAQAEAEVQRSQADVAFHQKQFDRIKELNDLKGIEKRVVEEKLLQLQAAQATERSSNSAVTAAKQQAAAAESRVALTKADLTVAQAKSRVAETKLERAKVLLSYTKVTSPYDGVVTARKFHRGAFIRSPEQGGTTPLLEVDRTDLMRISVKVPEREVPYVQPGDAAVIRFDALPERVFAGTIARIAHSEDAESRTMLAEIDLENPEDLIRDHMFGRVDIELERTTSGTTVPSTCLVGSASNGQGQLYVIEDGQAVLRKVKLGKDNGQLVEVLEGVSPDDEIILRPAAGLQDGTKVTSVPSGAK